jgi:hypothetical protein
MYYLLHGSSSATRWQSVMNTELFSQSVTCQQSVGNVAPYLVEYSLPAAIASTPASQPTSDGRYTCNNCCGSASGEHHYYDGRAALFGEGRCTLTYCCGICGKSQEIHETYARKNLGVVAPVAPGKSRLMGPRNCIFLK